MARSVRFAVSIALAGTPRKREGIAVTAKAGIGTGAAGVAGSTMGRTGASTAAAVIASSPGKRTPALTGTMTRSIRARSHGLLALALCTIAGMAAAIPGFAAPEPVSDDFNAPSLNSSLWTVVNPVGDGTVSLNGTNALIGIPAGPTHDAWVVNNAVRIMQGAGNVDFEVEAKFDSPVTTGTQMQGILVEQGGSSYLRFDIYHDGTSPRLFAASISGGSGTTRYSAPLSGLSAPFWIRVKRVGNAWTESYSVNGTTFTAGASFTHTLVVGKIGMFAGTYKSPTPAPAFTASVDYFFNTASPIVPEDGPPVITAVATAPSSTAATVTWTTNEAATSRVDHGPTTTYGTTVNAAGLVTNHAVGLTGLTCGTVYHYRVTSLDAVSNATSSFDATFTTSACAAGGPVSDDFHAGALNTSLWSFVNPVGNTTVSLNGTNVLIGIPAGPAHDAWAVNNAARIMQAAPNGDFEIEAKFDSVVMADTQMQGILIEQNTANYLRFDIFHDGTTAHLFAGSIIGGSGTPRFNTPIGGVGGAVWIRVRRAGNTWTESYSTNGVSFTPAAAFTQPLTVAKVGPFAGTNRASGAAPAFTASIDYFFNTSSPIVPEDGPSDTTPPVITGVSAAPGLDTASVGWTTNEPATSLVDYGLTTAYASGAPPNVALVTSHTVALSGLTCGTSYHYRVSSSDAAGNAAASPDESFTTSACPDTTSPVISAPASALGAGTVTLTWATNEPATSRAAYGLTSACTSVSPTDASLVTNHGILLEGPACGITYHYRVISSDAAGNTANSPDRTFTTSACIDKTPPLIGSLSATAAPGAASIAWTTNEAATSRVEYGLTGSYGMSSPIVETLVTSHALTLGGLRCGTLHHFRVVSADASANAASSSDATFTTAVCFAGPPASDDFHAPTLNTDLWSVIDPLGGASVSVHGTNVRIGVPGGAAHDPWTINNAPRLMQPAPDNDMEIEAKFDTTTVPAGVMQGILVEQNKADFVRFDVLGNAAGPRLFAGSVTLGVGTTRLNTPLMSSGSSIWLRVRREGGTWTMSWSTNGSAFTTAASFSHLLAVSKVGVFAGNSGSGPAAAPFTSSIDYFFNMGAPVAPEDGPDSAPPALSPATVDASGTEASIRWSSNEAATSSVEYGPTSAYGSSASVPFTGAPFRASHEPCVRSGISLPFLLDGSIRQHVDLR